MKRTIRHPDDQRPTRKVNAAQFRDLARRNAGQPILLVCGTGTPVDGVPIVDDRRPTVATPPIPSLVQMLRDKRDTELDAMPFGATVGRQTATVMFDPRSLELDSGVVAAVVKLEKNR